MEFLSGNIWIGHIIGIVAGIIAGLVICKLTAHETQIKLSIQNEKSDLRLQELKDTYKLTSLVLSKEIRELGIVLGKKINKLTN